MTWKASQDLGASPPDTVQGAGREAGLTPLSLSPSSPSQHPNLPVFYRLHSATRWGAGWPPCS